MLDEGLTSHSAVKSLNAMLQGSIKPGELTVIQACVFPMKVISYTVAGVTYLQLELSRNHCFVFSEDYNITDLGRYNVLKKFCAHILAKAESSFINAEEAKHYYIAKAIVSRFEDKL